jgi:hypothetical protein
MTIKELAEQTKGFFSIEYKSPISGIAAKHKARFKGCTKAQKVVLCSADYGKALDSAKYRIPDYSVDTKVSKVAGVLFKHIETQVEYIQAFRNRSVNSIFLDSQGNELDFKKDVYPYLIPSKQKIYDGVKVTDEKGRENPPYMKFLVNRVISIKAMKNETSEH